MNVSPFNLMVTVSIAVREEWRKCALEPKSGESNGTIGDCSGNVVRSSQARCARFLMARSRARRNVISLLIMKVCVCVYDVIVAQCIFFVEGKIVGVNPNNVDANVGWYLM
jgi:hypothetical protein